MRNILIAGLLIVVGCSPSKQTGGGDMQVPEEVEAQMDEAVVDSFGNAAVDSAVSYAEPDTIG